MAFFVGTLMARKINTGTTVKVFIENCNAILELSSGAGDEVRYINKGDMIVDPVTDDEVKVISATGTGIYVETFNGDRQVLPLADTILANL